MDEIVACKGYGLKKDAEVSWVAGFPARGLVSSKWTMGDPEMLAPVTTTTTMVDSKGRCSL